MEPLAISNLLQIVNAIKELNFSTIIDLIQEMISNGKEQAALLDGLINLYRDILNVSKR